MTKRVMDDTSPQIEELYRRMLMARSGSDRLRMGAGMFDAAKQLVRASLPEGLSEDEIRVQLFRRFYATDFDAERREEIERYLRGGDENTSR